ncbi:hypothetical protein Tco_1365956 [Tanacetum coccineum]
MRGGCSDSGISSLRSTGGGVCRDGGSGGNEGGGNAAVTASMRVWVDAILSVWIWVRHPGDGGECAGGAVHLARRSPAEGGDSEVGGDGDGVVMARSLSTSASGGRDMEV